MASNEEEAVNEVLQATFGEYISSQQLYRLKDAAHACLANGGTVRVSAYGNLKLTFEFKGETKK